MHSARELSNAIRQAVDKLDAIGLHVVAESGENMKARILDLEMVASSILEKLDLLTIRLEEMTNRAMFYLSLFPFICYLMYKLSRRRSQLIPALAIGSVYFSVWILCETKVPAYSLLWGWFFRNCRC